MEQKKAGPGHQEDTLGEPGSLVKTSALAFRSIACTPQPDHQGLQAVLTPGWASSFSEPISASLPHPSISLGPGPGFPRPQHLLSCQWPSG